jgi:hypothetical protein
VNRCALALAGLWGSLFLSFAALPVAAVEDVRVSWVQTPAGAAPLKTGTIGQTVLAPRYLEGMEVVESVLQRLGSAPHAVAPGFSVSTDPAYDPTGSRLLFAGRETPEAPFQIWQLADDAAMPTRVFGFDFDCVQPVPMPAGGVAFVSTAAGEYDEHGGTRSLSIFAWQPGWQAPQRITFNPSSDFEPAVLNDGRLVYSSWQHVGANWPRGNTALLVVNSDGTGVFPYHGNHQGSWLKRGVAATDSDILLHIEADAIGTLGGGSLFATNLNDSFAPATPVSTLEGFEVADVAMIDADSWIISARILDENDRFGLYLLDGNSLERLRHSGTVDALAPTVGVRSWAPDLRFSTVVEGTEYGYLLILDVRDTDRDLQAGAAPVASVRVIEALPTTNQNLGSTRFEEIEGREGEPLLTTRSPTGIVNSRILGEVPLAEDGSVYLKVPANRPIRIQLVDSEGFSALNERAWFWVRPNERRVCIGCHEDRELSPLNRAALAASRQPTDLMQPSDWQEINFVSDIKPILQETCAVASCHKPPHPTAAMNLSTEPCLSDTEAELSRIYEPAYASLFMRQPGKPWVVGGRRVHPGNARQSPLMWMLYGRALAPQYEPAPFERPMVAAHPGPMLPESELDLIRKWLDLGAPYCSAGAGGSSPNPSFSRRAE